MPDLVKWAIAGNVEAPAEVANALWSFWRITGLRCFDSAKISDPGANERIARRRIVARSVALAQRRERALIAQVLQDADVQYVFLKAMDLSPLPTKLSDGRCSYDIDVGVLPEELDQSVSALRTFGYAEHNSEQFFRYHRHYEAPPLFKTVPLRIASELDQDWFWEECQLGKYPLAVVGGELCASVKIDLHHRATHVLPISWLLDEVWASDGLRAPKSSKLATLLIIKIYFEGVQSYRTGMHAYFDLCTLWNYLNLSDRIDCINQLEALNLSAAGFYVLSRLPQVFGISLEELQIRIDHWQEPPAGRTPADCNDFGDMWPKLIGVRLPL